MPIYEYECPQCGYRDEFLEQSYDEDEPTIHYCVCDSPMCRVISASSIVFKDYSWYKPREWWRG